MTTWTGKKYDAERPLEESLSLMREELDGMEGLIYEIHLEEPDNGFTEAKVIVDVLEPYGDLKVMGVVNDKLKEYNYSKVDEDEDIWDMGLAIFVRRKPPITV